MFNFFRFDNLFSGMRNYKDVWLSVFEGLGLIFVSLDLKIKQYKTQSFFKKTFNCSLTYLRGHYIFIDNRHIEVNTFYGIFIENTHRLYDNYPMILGIDKNPKVLNLFPHVFQGTLCTIETCNIDITKDELELSTKVDSISLSLVLDEIRSLEQIENFLINMKSLLNNGGTIFGFTIVGQDINHRKKAQEYIHYKNHHKIWFNKDRTIDELEEIFKKHFDEVIINVTGSLLAFKLSLKKIPKNTKSLLLDINNVEGKYIIINQHNKIK